jgi:hypothetical protein
LLWDADDEVEPFSYLPYKTTHDFGFFLWFNYHHICGNIRYTVQAYSSLDHLQAHFLWNFMNLTNENFNF